MPIRSNLPVLAPKDARSGGASGPADATRFEAAARQPGSGGAEAAREDAHPESAVPATPARSASAQERQAVVTIGALPTRSTPYDASGGATSLQGPGPGRRPRHASPRGSVQAFRPEEARPQARRLPTGLQIAPYVDPRDPGPLVGTGLLPAQAGDGAPDARLDGIRGLLSDLIQHGEDGHERGQGSEFANKFLKTLSTVGPIIGATTMLRNEARYGAAALSPAAQYGLGAGAVGLDGIMVIGNAYERYTKGTLTKRALAADMAFFATSVVATANAGFAHHGVSAVGAHVYRYARAPIEGTITRKSNVSSAQNVWREVAFASVTTLVYWGIQMLVFSAQSSNLARSGQAAFESGAGFGRSQGPMAADSAFNMVGEIMMETLVPYIAAAIFGTEARGGAREVTVDQPIWTREGLRQSREAMSQARVLVGVGPGVTVRAFLGQLRQSLTGGATSGTLALQNSFDQGSAINQTLTPGHTDGRTIGDHSANGVASLYFALETTLGVFRNAKPIADPAALRDAALEEGTAGGAGAPAQGPGDDGLALEPVPPVAGPEGSGPTGGGDARPERQPNPPGGAPSAAVDDRDGGNAAEAEARTSSDYGSRAESDVNEGPAISPAFLQQYHDLIEEVEARIYGVEDDAPPTDEAQRRGADPS